MCLPEYTLFTHLFHVFSSQFDHLLDVCALCTVPGAQKWTLADLCNRTVLTGEGIGKSSGPLCSQGMLRF